MSQKKLENLQEEVLKLSKENKKLLQQNNFYESWITSIYEFYTLAAQNIGTTYKSVLEVQKQLQQLVGKDKEDKSDE